MYLTQLNHHKILDGIFSVHGCPKEKSRTIRLAVDIVKLDKVLTVVYTSNIIIMAD